MLTKNPKFFRYFCFTKEGVKIIKRFNLGEPVIQLDNCTPWGRGTGPFSLENYQSITAALKKRFCGVPKSPEQKEKMRQAKLGVKKSPAHVLAMCAAQKLSRSLRGQK